jgi:hypothetical protein
MAKLDGVAGGASLMTFDCLRAGLKWRGSWLVTIPIGLAIGAMAGVYLVVPLVYGPPVYVLTSDLIDAKIHPGSVIRFRIKVAITAGRQCAGYVTREISRRVSVDGRELWEKYRMPLVGAPIPDATEKEYVIAVPVPITAEPGAWRFLGRTTFDCGFWLGGIKNYDTPPLYFNITPKE